MTNYVVSVDFSTGRKEIIKEVAAVRVTKTEVTCLFVGTFLPPPDCNIIPRFKQQAVAYQERHVHGIRWEDGKFEAFQITPLLKAFILPDSIIAVYGDQAAEFVYETLDQGVFNMQKEWSVPRWSALPELEMEVPCSYHHPVSTTCTGLKALKYAHWLQTHKLVTRQEFLP